jgi:hypothetical protein
VTGYLKRVNDPSFNYDNFYQNHFKTFSSEASLSQSNQNNEYNKYLRQQDSKSLEDAKLMRSVLEKGESWSEEYSDEELTKLMTEVSLLQETDRRKFILSRPTRFSVGFDYGTYLSDAQNDDDLNYKRQSRYSMELDVEATPFLRHEKFERFTLNGTVRLNQTAFSFDNYNADLSERSLTAGANWYPFYAPYRLETGLLFLGTYFRFGRASATAPSLNEKASYTLYSLPGLRAGLKYMMKSHFGLRLILSLETLKLERFESSQTTPKLPEETNLLEGKFNIGFNYAF